VDRVDTDATALLSTVHIVDTAFEDCAKTDPLFRPELALAEKILALIRGGAVDRSTREQVRAALDAPIAEHYGGSGWCDLVRRTEEWLEVAAEQDVGPKR
jgi:hypothetical protein